MSIVMQHTHYMPKRWRGKENSERVRLEFETLFQVNLLAIHFVLCVAGKRIKTGIFELEIIPSTIDETQHY